VISPGSDLAQDLPDLSRQLRLPGGLAQVQGQAQGGPEVGVDAGDRHGSLARGGLAPARDALDFVLGARPLLAADAELAPAPEVPPVPVEQIPCLHPFAGPDLPEKLEDFLRSGPRPVYLGFGSMTDPNAARTTTAVIRTPIVSEL